MSSWMSSRAVLFVRKLLFGFSSFLAFRGLRLGVGAAVEHAKIIDWLKPDVIVDVGANRGQFSLIARLTCGDATIIAFEPLPVPKAIYERLFARQHNVSCKLVAIGDKVDTIEMSVAESDDSSSLRTPGAAQMALFGTRTAARTTVEVRPLSDLLRPEDLGRSAMLKIDVQGFEMEVLEGAQPLLRCFQSVYVEASYIELYEGQKLAPAVDAFLLAQGFKSAGAYNLVWSKDLGPVQADLLFVR